MHIEHKLDSLMASTTDVDGRDDEDDDECDVCDRTLSIILLM